MLVISIVAATLTAIATTLLFFNAPSPMKVASQTPQNDQRGITLQTLIVTAVLVLMAVAAGVVIVAITTNAAEDLEDQSSDIIGACQPAEIRDPRLEALGIGGGNGGVDSSAIGCLRVCYVSGTGSVVTTTASGNVNELEYSRTVVSGKRAIEEDFTFNPPTLVVRVSASQDRCEVVNTITGEITQLSD